MKSYRRGITTVGISVAFVVFILSSVLAPAAVLAQTGWQPQTLPALEEGVTYNVSDLKALNGNEAWIAGNVNTGESVILKTLDGGTWNLMFRKGENKADPWQSFPWPFSRLSVVDSNNAWVAGVFGFTAFTTDGGATWSHETTPCGPNPSGTIMHNYALKAVSATNVWVGGWDRYDYGLIWHRPYTGSCEAWGYYPYRQEAAYGRATVLAIDAADATNAWAVGYPGIVHTADGGATWVTEVASPGGLLADVAVVSPSVAWAVGAGGLILKTVDGGAHWVVQGSGVTEALNKISAVNVNVAWVVGGNGTILKTIDGGATWRSQVSGTNATLVGVAAATATTAWAVGDGVVFATTDGGTFQPLSAPGVSMVNPAGGPIAGGTVVDIMGRDIRPGARVYFGSVLATIMSGSDGVHVTVPAHAAGIVDVTVVNPDGQSATLARAFAYADTQPLIVRLSPSYGYMNTQVDLQIFGAALTLSPGTYEPVPTVNINGTPVAGVYAAYDWVQVTFDRSLLSSAGMANITVTTAAGTSNTLQFAINYGSVPVNMPSPPVPPNRSVSVPSLSGSVQATFYGLTWAGWIMVGKAFEQPGWLAGNSPPPAGYAFLPTYYYDVSTYSSMRYKAATICFPYADADVTAAGLNESKLRLMRLIGNTSSWEDVTFTLDTAANVICGTTAYSTLMTQFALAQGPGPAPPPAITSITPGFGPPVGGTTVTVNGNSFQPNAAVMFGGIAATNVTVQSGMTITATIPAHALGLVDVVVTNPDLQTGTLATGFEYIGPPTVTSITPNSGRLSGYTSGTITGTGFRTGAIVKFGGTQANYSVVNDTTITGNSPAHAAGHVDIIVTNTDGQYGTLVNGFTYVAPPTVTKVAPNTGPSVGGTLVTITGTGFMAGATVKVGLTAASGVEMVNATTITAVTPPGAAGSTTSITVYNPDGQSGILGQAFTYVNMYTVIGSVLVGSTGSIGCDSPVLPGASSTCRFTYDTGWYCDSLTDNGIDVFSQLLGNQYTIENITQNHVVVVMYQEYLARRISSGSTYYHPNIEEALNSAVSNDRILLLNMEYPAVSFSHPIEISLEGGYASGYSSVSGFTNFHGEVIITRGNVTIKNISIK